MSPSTSILSGIEANIEVALADTTQLVGRYARIGASLATGALVVALKGLSESGAGGLTVDDLLADDGFAALVPAPVVEAIAPVLDVVDPTAPPADPFADVTIPVPALATFQPYDSFPISANLADGMVETATPGIFESDPGEDPADYAGSPQR